MKRKLIGTAALVLAATLCLSSCAATLKVESVDYPGLKKMKAAEPDEEAIRNWTFFSLNPYILYCVNVSVTDQGELLVSNRCDANNQSMLMRGNLRYFIGTNLGEYGGWVKMFPYNEDLIAEDKREPVVIVYENCAGFIEIDNNNGYFITARHNPEKRSALKSEGVLFTTAATESVVHKLTLPPDMSGWTWEEIGLVDGHPITFVHDETANIVYIVTNAGLWEFSLEDYTSRLLADLSLWRSSAATSMVKLDGKLYIGMSMGIYEYDIATEESLWYPMDFEKYAAD